MINTKLLCVATITFCLICPILVGFMMPSEKVEDVAYVTGDQTNITSGLYNDVNALPVTYTSVVNNQFCIDYDLWADDCLWFPDGEVTTTPTGFPALELMSNGALTPATISVTGEFDIPNYIALQMMGLKPYAVTMTTVHTDHTQFEYDGVYYESMVYFPGTKLVYAYDTLTQQIKEIGTVVNVTADTGVDNIAMKYYTQQKVNGKLQYLDPNAGFVSTGSVNQVWANGQQNAILSMVMESASNTFHYNYDGFGQGYQITVVDGTISVTPTFGIDPETKVLGSTSVYPYILVEMNGVEHTLKFIGLYGMIGYADDVRSHKGNAVSYELTASAINNIVVTDDVRYYISEVKVLNDYTAVMNNVTVDPWDYYPQMPWSLNLRNGMFHGDTLTLNFKYSSGGSIVSCTSVIVVEDGVLKSVPVMGDGEVVTADFPLNNLVIALIPTDTSGVYKVVMNGSVLANPLTMEILQVKSLTLGFDDVWRMNVFVAPVNEEPYSVYEWTPGTFNIDETTFYLIGMLTAGVMGVFSGILAFRFDVGGFLPLFISGICGGIFLMLLISVV